MAGAIGLLSGNDFDENLLKHVGDRYGITAVNGMRDLSNKTKDILNREKFNIKEKKILRRKIRVKINGGIDLFPNSKSDNRGSGGASGDAKITLDGKGSLTGLNEQDFRDLHSLSVRRHKEELNEYGVAANVLTKI